MRIAYVISSLKVGGAEVALTQLVPRIKEKGHDVFVAFFHDGPMRARLEAAGIAVYQIKGLVGPYDPVAWWRLYRWLHALRVDLVHTSLWLANIMGRMVGAWLKISVVSDLHGNCRAEGRIRNWGDRLTAGYTAVTIAVSESVAVAYQAEIIGKRSIKLITVPNAIDTNRFIKAAVKAPLGRFVFNIPDEAFVIGAVGRLEAIKGYDLLIEAFALLPSNAYLVLVGDGSCRKELELLAAERGVAERYVVTGFRSDVFRLYQLFDCFAIASYSEGLSLALLEAMAAGCPVVTTNQTMTHDVITHGVTGLLVTTRSPGDYAALLSQLMSVPAYGKQVGLAGQQLVCRQHDLPQAIDVIDAMYHSLKKSN